MSILEETKDNNFLKALNALPEAKALSLLLLIAEEANQAIGSYSNELAKTTKLHIDTCWRWLGDKNTSLTDQPFDSHILLFHTSKKIKDALTVKNAILDYITYRYLLQSKENKSSIQRQDQFSMLEYVFLDLPLQNFITQDILSFFHLK